MRSTAAYLFLVACTSTSTAADASTHLRQRQLQWGGFLGQDNNNGDAQQQNPFEGLFDGMMPSLQDAFNFSDMDPLDLGSDGVWLSFELQGGDDTTNALGLFTTTNCSGGIHITVQPGILTGLSTFTMEQFELVPDTEQMESDNNNFWSMFSSRMFWSGTFEMFATAESLVLEGAITMESGDPSCFEGSGITVMDGSFSTGVKMSMTNMVIDMTIDIGGNSPADNLLDTWFGNYESVADTLSATNVSFTYDSWTIEFDNPQLNETINVGELIESVGSLLQEAVNSTDIDGAGSSFATDIVDGIDNEILVQANSYLSGVGFTF